MLTHAWLGALAGWCAQQGHKNLQPTKKDSCPTRAPLRPLQQAESSNSVERMQTMLRERLAARKRVTSYEDTAEITGSMDNTSEWA